MRRIVVDPVHPDPALLRQAADVVRAGGLVAFPTDTLYGLAVNPFDAKAVLGLFAAKARDPGRAVPLIASDLEQVIASLGSLPALGRRLAVHFWPGPLTIVVPAPPSLASVAASDGTVGVRVPRHAAARALCREADLPLTATSANISGVDASSSPDVVARSLGDRIDLLVDAGATPGGPPSTLVDVTGNVPRQIRAGAIAWTEIEACVR
jgi:L-threonylcarbamoyladenylate synthase